jgi:DNA (cytosine-5)-methyltransferase 1
MKLGRLPTAAVSSDVNQLYTAWLKQHVVSKGSPEAIVAGFPCVGFSLVGKREGFQNPATNLFTSILRLLDDLPSVRWVFLENVPQILKSGMSHVVQELHARRGFSLYWCVVAARDVGAPHIRKRWFCVASKGARRQLPRGLLEAVEKDSGYHAYTRLWLSSHQQRTVCPGGKAVDQNLKKATAKRLFLLGNAVVPDAARHAFLHLLRVSTSNQTEQGSPVALSRRNNVEWPSCGCVKNSALYCVPHPSAPHMRSPLPITLIAERYKPSKGYKGKNSLEPLRGVVNRPYWATPRAHMTGAAQIMTERTSHDLPTQVRHEKDTPDAERKCQVAPEFVEFLMGYPKGWTKLSTKQDKKT